MTVEGATMNRPDRHQATQPEDSLDAHNRKTYEATTEGRVDLSAATDTDIEAAALAVLGGA
jgi:hypothetical protein